MLKAPSMLSSGPVVSNTTPLIVLSGAGLIDLLRSLYGMISIPDMVRDEYVAGMKPGEPDISGLPWIHVHSTVPLVALRTSLDAGETAAISLAVALNASRILLDDRDARSEARTRGLVVTGSVGVLLEAKRIGLLPLIAPVLDQMSIQGRYISARLRNEVLRLAGETDP